MLHEARFVLMLFGLLTLIAGIAVFGVCFAFARAGFEGLDGPGVPSNPFDWKALFAAAVIYVPLILCGIATLVFAWRMEVSKNRLD